MFSRAGGACFKGCISTFTEREKEPDQLSQALNLFLEEKRQASSERKMILTWTSGVPMSACFGFRDKVAKCLSMVWDDTRIAGAGNLETTGPFPTTILLSSVTCSLSLSLPEPQGPSLFHGETICLYCPELS